jgi:hypothetical protein
MPLALTGCRLHSTPDETYFKKIAVRSFSKTSQGSESWPGSHDMYGIYIGPAIVGDINTVVSGPGLKLGTPNSGFRPQKIDFVRPLAQGPVSGDCGVLVDKFQKSMQPPSSWHISASQLEQVRQGRMDIVVITVTCGHG